MEFALQVGRSEYFISHNILMKGKVIDNKSLDN